MASQGPGIWLFITGEAPPPAKFYMISSPLRWVIALLLVVLLVTA